MSEQPAESHPLDNVVNDYDAKLECMDWLLEELEKRREIDSLREEILAGGWNADEAEELLESARKQTRHLRGAQSREEVAEQVERRYRKTMRAGVTMGRFGGAGDDFRRAGALRAGGGDVCDADAGEEAALAGQAIRMRSSWPDSVFIRARSPPPISMVAQLSALV